MNDRTKQLITIALTLLVAAIVQIAAVYGIVIPAMNTAFDRMTVDASPLPASGGIGVQAAYPIQMQNSGRRMAFKTGSTLDVQQGATLYSSDGDVIISDNANITGTLAIDSVTFSGPVKYGTAATYTSGARIAHGFTVTPTVCIISPMQAITSTYTITATGFTTNMPSTASPIYWMCGK